MTADTFEPREVEPNAIIRWAKQAAELIARGPLPFLFLVIICPVFEKAAELGDYSSHYCQILGGILMPFLFGAGLLAARVSDVGSREAKVREILNEKQLWLYVGCMVLATAFLTLIDYSVIRIVSWAFPHQIILSIIASLTSLSVADGLFALPLILLSRIPFGRAWELSSKGMTINSISVMEPGLAFSKTAFQYFVVMGLIPIALCLCPPYGIPGSICVCYLSGFVYVGYRDIFERRDANKPREAEKRQSAVSTATASAH